MATAGKLVAHVVARTSLSSGDVMVGSDWHDDGWRCRIAAKVYGLAAWIGRIADRIDTPEDHPR